MKAATIVTAVPVSEVLISIHAAREGGDNGNSAVSYRLPISIHAAREGGDRKRIDVINISANSKYESDHSPLFIFHYTVKKAALQAKTCLLCAFRFLSA